MNYAGTECVVEICLVTDSVEFPGLFPTQGSHDYNFCELGDHPSWHMEFLQVLVGISSERSLYNSFVLHAASDIYHAR